ncbi:MAG: hypothetical protein R2698_11835 [Microthrixaceae bacterium]
MVQSRRDDDDVASALVVSFAVPILAVTAALWTRFRHRVFFVATAVVGVVVSVGAHPFTSPSPYGALFKSFAQSGVGLSLRSTPGRFPSSLCRWRCSSEPGSPRCPSASKVDASRSLRSPWR